jgi:hypothetical protein
MDIIFQDLHTTKEAQDSLVGVLKTFKDKYQIAHVREMHLTITLVDSQGDDVELVDSETGELYRIFEVVRKNQALVAKRTTPALQLVVDNTRKR